MESEIKIQTHRTDLASGGRDGKKVGKEVRLLVIRQIKS